MDDGGSISQSADEGYFVSGTPFRPALVPKLIRRGAILPLPQYVFVFWCLIKHWSRLHCVIITEAQGKFTFHFYLHIHHFFQRRAVSDEMVKMALHRIILDR
jgi:hypothetical protein